ncbi:glutathione peroxidase [Suicoccus acidiformans]|uniref:Glutathione peroxidase n=1 Tax=Suicoccus acidiformans TaxID=2036206 RepID=A0A347WMZ5_9LACT|nr:glutathione peroxidase [Suicoccus acidiformans]AXY26452.1 glutathione peroxidase [Suicoccus acidiformans]
MSLPNFSLIDSDGRPYRLKEFNTKVLLLVNTASDCGFSKQFAELEELHQRYQTQGFSVLAFPSNEFKQESLDNHALKQTYREKFGVTFPINQLIHVNGEHTDPLFQWLKQELPGSFNSNIKWNFTKFLINRDGTPVKRYSPLVKPHKIAKDIEKLL